MALKEQLEAIELYERIAELNMPPPVVLNTELACTWLTEIRTTRALMIQAIVHTMYTELCQTNPEAGAEFKRQHEAACVRLNEMEAALVMYGGDDDGNTGGGHVLH